jgi:hypothetical protein
MTVAISNPDRSTSKPLQLRIIDKSRISGNVSFWEVSGLPGYAYSHLSKVPLQGFVSPPARFRYCFCAVGGAAHHTFVYTLL